MIFSAVLPTLLPVRSTAASPPDRCCHSALFLSILVFNVRENNATIFPLVTLVLLQVSFDCGRLWKPSSQWMSWRRDRSPCRLVFWPTDKWRRGWRWTSACLPPLAAERWSGRASWPWSPRRSRRKPADASPARKRVSFPPRIILFSLFKAGSWRILLIFGCSQVNLIQKMWRESKSEFPGPLLCPVSGPSPSTPRVGSSLCQPRSSLLPHRVSGCCLSAWLKWRSTKVVDIWNPRTISWCPRCPRWVWVWSISFVPSGVEAITAPVNLRVCFTPPLALPRCVTVELWEASDGVGFRVRHHGGKASHLTGLISRSWKSMNATDTRAAFTSQTSHLSGKGFKGAPKSRGYASFIHLVLYFRCPGWTGAGFTPTFKRFGIIFPVI